MVFTRHDLIVTTVVFFICLFALSLWGFYSAIFPIKIISTHTPRDFGFLYEDVSFYTQDHLLLRGWFVPNKNKNAKTIILLHGYGADKGDLLPSRLFLAQNYNLLFFDFRYFGQSEGSYSTVGLNEIKDLKAAIHFLKKRGIHEVGVWGLSMGGAVALMTAKEMKEIKGMVVESSYARLDFMIYQYFSIPLLRYPLGLLMRLWGYLFLGYDVKSVSPMEAASRLEIPVLLIYSENDQLIPYAQAVLLRDSLAHNPHAEFLVYKNIPHGGLEKGYEIKIQDFFRKGFLAV